MDEFVEHLREMFQEFGPVQARRMFGGYGLYHDGLMFALVAENTLYLKVDSESAPQFEAIGLEAFQYPKGGKLVTMSYRRAPEEVLEDPEQASVWARRAFEAAVRSGARYRGGR